MDAPRTDAGAARSVHVDGPNHGIISTGDHANNTVNLPAVAAAETLDAKSSPGCRAARLDLADTAPERIRPEDWSTVSSP